MLTALSIKNYALIEDLSVDFSDGFTVISGETGSGKSILIESIELLTGTRADISYIRSGCSVCTITASFEYKNSKITDFLNNFSIFSDNNTILIRRTIEKSGKSKAFINDSQVSISVLAGLGELLIDFHGQDKKHSLLNLDSQLEILDNEILDIKPLLATSAVLHTKVKNLQTKIEAMNLSDSDRERRIDLYSFQVKEIEDANLELDEDERLETELPKLKNAEKITALAQEVVEILYSSENAALDGILKAKKNIEIINSYGADGSEAMSLIELSYYHAEEARREVENILSKTHLDPEKLDATLERTELIKKLKKKYGNTIESIIEYKNKISNELNSLCNYKDDSEKIKEELELETKCLIEICETINKKRQKAAQVFAKTVQKELFDLDIKNAIFEVKFSRKLPSSNGYDLIEFMFCANKGEKTLPLKNTASGGELSRVLLAIELSSKVKRDQTTIFDEIDTGTSGKASEKIGEKLSKLSRKKQVFSITHLAQVAAFARMHVKIYKEIVNSRTYTKAKALSEIEHIEEIARMISGEKITKTALDHAKNLVAAYLQ
ncbi:MAG: DNA repair protein RecN [Endomicrobium sp.]|uniref:DNA repair protein RecN n=1 Tax=Candidatus Endomicrobiellum pyrsonymphae TaxID=1408203 RepID=UPI00357F9D71|nr:DNA repair protein RecN [Endomicrobium sp.]